MVQETQTALDHIEIQVNKTTIREDHRIRTGLQIKEDAIAAGVKIKITYVLDLESEHESIRIPDDKELELKSGMKFLAHPGGSDS